jgi:cell division protein FtsI/penicillin-binding protein 2
LRSDSDTTQLQSLTNDTVREETARWMIEHPMTEVVSRGTGKRARVPGYQVFGKTGTAQCLSPDGGYASGKYVSSFLCGAPVEDPQVLVLVVVNQASVGSEAFGGKVAAPAAANILRQTLVYLRVSPETDLMRHAADWESDVELQ